MDMFKLDNKLKKIEEYFAKIIDEYNFEIKLCNSNKVELKNDVCILEITTQRYYCDLQITFKNILNSKEYSIGEVLNKKSLTGAKVLSDIENNQASLITDELENGLFCFGIIIKTYFAKILSGDFSEIEI